MTEAKQEQLNEMYTRLQMIDAQIKQLQQQMMGTEQQMQDIATVKDGLTDLEKIQEGNEILVPIAGGIFAKAKLQDTSELIVNIGASVNVKKPIEEVIKLIDTQGKDMETSFLHMQEQFQALYEEATEINNQISSLIT